MKAQPRADVYSDSLLASFGATTATGLSQRLEGGVSHDQVTRYVAGPKNTAADLWLTVKPFVRQVQSPAGVLLLDDAMEEKPYTDAHDLVCWHDDHAKERSNCLGCQGRLVSFLALDLLRLPGRPLLQQGVEDGQKLALLI